MAVKEKVLIIGSGAREHAIGWKLKHPDRQLYFTPGNAGTAAIGENIPVSSTDVDAIRKVSSEKNISFVVPSMEKTLAVGVVDALQEDAVDVYGPNQSQARLEFDKFYSHDLMEKLGIPRPRGFKAFHERDAFTFISENDPESYVIKARGLADGKGVFLPDSKDEARDITHQIMALGTLGEAGKNVLFQERLHGKEESIIAIVSGRTVIPLPKALDYKRRFEKDRGPNTGGMGAVISPNNFPSQEDLEMFIFPIANFYADQGKSLSCRVYAQKIKTPSGTYCLEYNMRPGDPEEQTQLRLLTSDLLTIMKKSNTFTLQKSDVLFEDDKAAVSIALVAPGYPTSTQLSDVLHGVRSEYFKDVVVFHAGTENKDGKLKVNGGRVLSVTAKSDNLPTALHNATRVAEEIQSQNPTLSFRSDIGQDVLIRKR